MLAEQLHDIAELRRRYEAPVIWAGDFNQNVAGSVRGGSHARRDRLAAALVLLGYVAWNGEAAHAAPGICAVDLICGPSDLRLVAHQRIDPRWSGIVMSDHAGHGVEIELP